MKLNGKEYIFVKDDPYKKRSLCTYAPLSGGPEVYLVDNEIEFVTRQAATMWIDKQGDINP